MGDIGSRVLVAAVGFAICYMCGVVGWWRLKVDCAGKCRTHSHTLSWCFKDKVFFHHTSCGQKMQYKFGTHSIGVKYTVVGGWCREGTLSRLVEGQLPG